MKTSIKFTDTSTNDVLRSYAEEKVAMFSKLVHQKDMEAAVCDVELRHDAHHNNGDVCHAEVTLEVHGKVYRASKVEPNFEKAIDKVKDDILQALRADKERDEHTFLKGAREAKEMLRHQD